MTYFINEFLISYYQWRFEHAEFGSAKKGYFLTMVTAHLGYRSAINANS